MEMDESSHVNDSRNKSRLSCKVTVTFQYHSLETNYRVSPNHLSTSPNQPKITLRSLSPPLTLATSITFVTLVTSIRIKI